MEIELKFPVVKKNLCSAEDPLHGIDFLRSSDFPEYRASH